MRKKLRISLLCGGPSPERGISLNSARSVCDHLGGDDIEIVPIYFDIQKKPYHISRDQLYSNTPSDFDFKLKSTASPLSRPKFMRLLASTHLAFPVMHGYFGEDGTIQGILEQLGKPFIGSSQKACKACFDKYDANEFIKDRGFLALPSIAVERGERNIAQKINSFFNAKGISRAIVKPAIGGSSIGVHSVGNAAAAIEKAMLLLKDGTYKRVVIEEFCRGTEFTAVILEARHDNPVCLLPVEIEADYHKHQIFDFRKKYLPTHQVHYHCPPRFSEDAISRVQKNAEQLFTLFGMRDFARFDGWLLPDGRIWFSDFNPISGMEQNSFLFLQAAQIGFSHRDVLRFIVRNACKRYGLPFETLSRASLPQKQPPSKRKRKKINIIFGGYTAERQVSVMSGTNVWLKLRHSKRYEPLPHILDTDGNVWAIPYVAALNHTVEEITEVCKGALRNAARLELLRNKVLARLAPLPWPLEVKDFTPKKMSMPEFIEKSAFIFIALHGGEGENGVLQRKLERKRVQFNGSGSKASLLAMDKYATSLAIAGLKKNGIQTARKLLLIQNEFRKSSSKDYAALCGTLWKRLTRELASSTCIVKPIADGCSAGIVRLYTEEDLALYLKLLTDRAPQIPINTLTNQHGIVEMPVELPAALLFEEFIETDRVDVFGNKLSWKKETGWVEVTVGVLGKKGRMRAFNPSITVAKSDVLSVEEKFQGGTGINITPPPIKYVPKDVTKKVKQRIELVAKTLGLSGYARIDAFLNIKTGEIIVIEANTLPALTPSTVLYHQALSEKKPLYPKELLEKIIELGK